MPLEYVIETEQISSAQITPSNCNAIQFINKGSNTAYVNDLPIAENESFAFSGDQLEHDTTRYRIRFGSDGTTSNLFVIRKRYRRAVR